MAIKSAAKSGLKRQCLKVKVAAAVKAIQRAYNLGIASRIEHGEDLRRSKRTKSPMFAIPKFAAQYGYHRDTIERARQFADVFDQPTVDQLCRECEKGEFPLGVSLIYRAMAVGDLNDCMDILRTAIRERWNLRRMASEIQKRSSAPTRSGRPRALPKSPTEASQAIVIRVVPVMRWLEDVKSSLDGKLDASLLGKISKAVGALDALVDAAS